MGWSSRSMAAGPLLSRRARRRANRRVFRVEGASLERRVMLTAFSVTGVAAAPLIDRRLEVWAVRNDGVLLTTQKATAAPGAAWKTWTVVATPTTVQDVAAARLSDGRVQRWAVGRDGSLFTSWNIATSPNATWSA